MTDQVSDPDILCFDHPDRRVFTFEHLKSDFKDVDVLPFRLPSPFRDAMDKPCCVVVRPSRGDFLDFNPGDDLHVALTDSEGRVVEFDKNG